MNLPDLLLSIFGMGNPFRYQSLAHKADFRWTPGHIRPVHIQGHLDGDYIIGAEAHDQGSFATNFLSWTTNAKGNIEYARSLIERLCEIITPLKPSVAYMGNATYTAFLFLSEPLSIRKADSLAAYVSYRVAPALSHTPKELGSFVVLPLHPNSRFIDRAQGWEQGPQVDAIAALTTTYTPDEVLAIQKPIPDLSIAEQAALNFKPGSIYPIILDWVKENPGGASIPRRMTELYPILYDVAQQKGHTWNWKNEGALSLHMASKFMREGLRKYMGMVLDRRYLTDEGDVRLWYSFRSRDMVKVG